MNVAIMRARAMMEMGFLKVDYRIFLHGVSAMNGCLDDDLKIIFIPKQEVEAHYEIPKSVICEWCGQETEFRKGDIKFNELDQYDLFGIAMMSDHDLIKVMIDVNPHKPNEYYHYQDMKPHLKTTQCKNLECKKTIYFRHSTRVEEKPRDIYEQKYYPENPSMKTMPHRSVNTDAFWYWADEIKGVMEDRCRKFRNKYGIQETIATSESEMMESENFGV